MASTLAVPPEQVTDALAFNAVPSWDSVNHINLMLAVEDAFGVAIPDDDIVELTSVGAIRRFLANTGAVPAA